MKKDVPFIFTLPGVVVATLAILLIPFVAMQFTEEVNWSPADFIIMGVLIFSTGLAYTLITRYMPNLIHKAAYAGAVGSTFLLIWVNIAVGLIGGGPHVGNFMYIGVVAVVIIGTYLSRFTAKGMELTMFAATGTLVLIAIIALMAGMQDYPGSSVMEIIGVNAFFAVLFAVSGLLFRFISIAQPEQKANS